jgi:hypothetical protein
MGASLGIPYPPALYGGWKEARYGGGVGTAGVGAAAGATSAVGGGVNGVAATGGGGGAVASVFGCGGAGSSVTM